MDPKENTDGQEKVLIFKNAAFAYVVNKFTKY